MKTDFDPQAVEKNGPWGHLVKYCIDLYEDIKGSDYRTKKIAEIKESIMAYEQDAEKATYPWPDASNIVLPLTTITVDNLEPRLVAGLTGKKPFVRMTEDAGEEADEQGEVVEAWYNGELEDVVGIEQAAMDLVHTILKEGTFYTLPGYNIDEVVRNEFQLDEGGNPVPDGEGKPIVVEVTDKSFEGGQLEVVPFTDVFIPDDADDWEASPVIQKKYPTYADLMRLRDRAGYQSIGEWLIKDKGDRTLQEEQQSPQQDLDGVKVTGKEVIEVIECSVSYIYQKEDQEDEEVTDFTEERIVVGIALDSQVLIYIQKLRDVSFKNQHILRRARLFPERGKAYGSPIYAKMRSIQIGASDTFNRGMNAADVAMVPWFIYGDKAGLPADITIHPGKGVKADDPNAVVFPKFSYSAREFIDFINMWVQFWERIVNIGDLQVGRQKDSGKHTATETLAVIQEGNIKHSYQSKTFREEFLDIIRALYDQYYMYMPFEKTFMFKGQQVSITRAMMQRPGSFRLTGSTDVANKMIERKENEDLYKTLRADPLLNPMQLVEDLLNGYGRTKTQKYINPQIAKVVQILTEMPQVAPLFEAAVQEAVQEGQAIEANAKQQEEIAKDAIRAQSL